MIKRIFNIFIVLASALILIMLLFFTNGINELLRLIYEINYVWIAIASSCMLFYWITDAFVIQTITKALSEKQRFISSLKTTMVGQFFNAITPFASGGQPMQVYIMVRDGIDVGHAASVMVLKSISYEVVLFIYTLTVFIFFAPFFMSKIPHFLIFYMIGTSVNLFVIFIYALFLYKEKTADKLLNALFSLLENVLRLFRKNDSFKAKLDMSRVKLEAALESFKEGAVILKGEMRLVVKIMMLQLIQYTFLFSIPFFIYMATDGRQPQYIKMLSSQALSNMMVSYVPTPGSTGGAEGIAYLFFGIYFSSKIILPVILVWRVIAYYYNIIFGGLVSFFSNK